MTITSLLRWTLAANGKGQVLVSCRLSEVPTAAAFATALCCQVCGNQALNALLPYC